MSITFNKDNNIFYLNNEKCTYAFCIDSGGYLCHLYFGSRIPEENIRYVGENNDEVAFAPIVNESERSSSLDVIPQEYPIYGMGDFRETAVLIRFAHC